MSGADGLHPANYEVMLLFCAFITEDPGLRFLGPAFAMTTAK